ncbi:MAG TPA: acylphosphatase [Solirubrobacteraceae bacterium]|nr:acylphosphatase [Solirubrobacteraceae bacterium]
MSGDSVRRRVVVHGHVQGVFFRDSTAERARSRGVAGWVRNRPDGSVEAVFEGDPDAVESMVRFCRSGPSSADVDDVEDSEESPERLSGFEVR